MPKNVRRSVCALFFLLIFALISALSVKTASAYCPPDSEGTWRGDDWSCMGAARDCAVVNVCAKAPMPV